MDVPLATASGTQHQTPLFSPNEFDDFAPAPQQEFNSWQTGASLPNYGFGMTGAYSVPKQTLSKRLASWYDRPPGGRGLWISLVVIVQLILGGIGAVHEKTLYAFIAVNAALYLLILVFGTIWKVAILVEKEGWIVGILGMGPLLLAAPVLNKYWDSVGRPVCLIWGAFLILFVWTFVPISIYAVMHP